MRPALGAARLCCRARLFETPIRIRVRLQPYQDVPPVLAAVHHLWHHTYVQRKVFWILVTLLSLITDVLLPLWWSLALFIPIVAFSWWVAYRSDWF